MYCFPCHKNQSWGGQLEASQPLSRLRRCPRHSSTCTSKAAIRSTADPFHRKANGGRCGQKPDLPHWWRLGPASLSGSTMQGRKGFSQLWGSRMWRTSGHCACSLAPCPPRPAQATQGGHESGLEGEAVPSLPVAKGYRASLLWEQHQLYPGQAGVTTLALLATWATGLKAQTLAAPPQFSRGRLPFPVLQLHTGAQAQNIPQAGVRKWTTKDIRRRCKSKYLLRTQNRQKS